MRDSFGCSGIVPCYHHHLGAHVLESLDRSGGIRFQGIGKSDYTFYLSAGSQVHYRFAFITESFRFLVKSVKGEFLLIYQPEIPQDDIFIINNHFYSPSGNSVETGS